MNHFNVRLPLVSLGSILLSLSLIGIGCEESVEGLGHKPGHRT
jgi:hypothetical protein